MEYTEKAIDILEAARDLFSKKGFKAVTTRELAKKANVNEVTIFRHFKNKENLFEQVISYSTSKPKPANYIDENEEDLKQFLFGIAKMLKTIFTDNIDIFKIELLEFQRTDKRQGIKNMPNKMKKMFADYLINKQQMNINEAELFAVTFLLAVHGLCMDIFFIQTLNPTPDFDKSVEFLISKFKE